MFLVKFVKYSMVDDRHLSMVEETIIQYGNNKPRQKLFIPVKLEEDEIHVWFATQRQSKSNGNWLVDYLRDEEKKRAGRYRIIRERERYIIRRGLLRLLLSAYLEKEPYEIDICIKEHGKPELCTTHDSTALQFNTSGSADQIMYVFSGRRRVGIDVEQIVNFPEIEKVADYCFTDKEILLLHSLDSIEQTNTFYLLWTRKEAFIKAIGKGLYCSLKNIDVSNALSDLGSYALIGKDITEDYRDYRIFDLTNKEGYAAALAVECYQ